MAGKGRASESTPTERQSVAGDGGGTTLDADEWEALLGRMDAAFGRAMNRPAHQVVVADAMGLLEHLDCVTGAFQADARVHARTVRERYKDVLGGSASASGASASGASVGGDGQESVETGAVAAMHDGGASDGNASGESEPEHEPLRYDRVPCGAGHLYVLYLRLDEDRSAKVHKYGAWTRPISARAPDWWGSSTENLSTTTHSVLTAARVSSFRHGGPIERPIGQGHR